MLFRFLPVLLLAGCEMFHVRPTPAGAAAPEDYYRANQSPPQVCASIDLAKFAWTTTAVVVGAASGSTGLAAILTDHLPKDVVGGISIGLTALAGVSTSVASYEASKYTRVCTVNLAGAQIRREPVDSR